MKKLMLAAAAAVALFGANAFAPASAHTVEVGSNYVQAGGPNTGVWEETNGCAGLQTAESDCNDDPDTEEVEMTPADTKVAP
jgi:hypothetical protein